MSLDDNSKQTIIAILSNQLKSKIDEFENANDMEKPFYTSLFSDEIVTLASILQSTYTWFGSQWENIAKIIAQNSNKFSDVECRYKLDGAITEEEEATIGRILRELDRGDRTPNLNDEKELIQLILFIPMLDKPSSLASTIHMITLIFELEFFTINLDKDCYALKISLNQTTI